MTNEKYLQMMKTVWKQLFFIFEMYFRAGVVLVFLDHLSVMLQMELFRCVEASSEIEASLGRTGQASPITDNLQPLHGLIPSFRQGEGS